MVWIRRLAALAACLFGLIQAAAEEARVAAAANFAPALEAIAAQFEAGSDHEIEIVSGSTGKLYAQIVNGAPFDVFLAADQARPERLETDGVALAGSRFTYAVGRLVLWRADGRQASEAALRGGDWRRLAMANPDLAPYGGAAAQVLAALGLEQVARGRLAYGENVGQAFAFVKTGAADLGFVALSQVTTLPLDAAGSSWEPPPDLYDPIRQDAVLLARASGNAAARAFMDHLKSDAAAAILRDHGYAPGA